MLPLDLFYSVLGSICERLCDLAKKVPAFGIDSDRCARLESVARSKVLLLVVMAVVLPMVVLAIVKYGMGNYFLYGVGGTIAVLVGSYGVSYGVGCVVSWTTPMDKKSAVDRSKVVVWLALLAMMALGLVYRILGV